MDHGSERADQNDAPDQAPFLRHGRKDEVGMAFGKILKMALAAVKETLAPDATGPDRDLRLGDVIAGAERVAVGVEEGLDALFLIAVHHAEHDRRSDADRSDWGRKYPPRKPGQEHHGHSAEQHHDAGTEVRLNQDQQRRYAQHRERRPNCAPLADLGCGNELVEAGESEDDRRLHKLRRLEADRPKVEPSPRPFTDEAEALDADQHHQSHAVERERNRLDGRFLHPRHGDSDDQKRHEHDRLLDSPRVYRASRCGVEHDQPEHRDPEDDRDQSPRQLGERPRNDGRRDHAVLAESGDSPLAERQPAVLRASRSSGVPPMLCSKVWSAATAFCRS